MTTVELLFRNGPVWLPGGRRTDAVAVHNGRIHAIGPDALELAAKRTVDLRGRLLIPGFQDAHCHPVWGGLELAACNLSGVTTRSGYLNLIDAYARANPDRYWITGGGWAMEAFPGGTPTRDLLDAIIPDRPVFLPNRDHHGAWVNTRALELAGIDANTPDPHDGRIERDGTGAPTGMLQEGAATLVASLVPRPTPQDLRAALLRAQTLFFSYGITAWQDAAVGDALGQPDTYDTYRAAAESGDLVARVRGALWWRREAGLEQLPLLAQRRHEATAPGFAATTVKMMLDGICENGSAALLDPYLGGIGQGGDGRGLSFFDPDDLSAWVTRLDAAGFQVHFHALGDRAVQEALDAVAIARATNREPGPMHHLAHLQLVDPEDVPRFAVLRAAATIQPLWATHEPQMDELTIPFLGEERSAHQYPFEALRRAGAHLAGGSDWPVTSANPIEGIHVAVNRQLPKPAGPAFLPTQRLALHDALAAYTASSAVVNGFDDAGSIRVGSRADLAVLDRDPFAADPAEIAATTVIATFVAGEQVYGQ